MTYEETIKNIETNIDSLNYKNQGTTDCQKLKNFILSPIFNSLFKSEYYKQAIKTRKIQNNSNILKVKTSINAFNTKNIDYKCIRSIKNDEEVKKTIGFNYINIINYYNTNTIYVDIETDFDNNTKELIYNFEDQNKGLNKCYQFRNFLLSPLFQPIFEAECYKTKIITNYEDNTIKFNSNSKSIIIYLESLSLPIKNFEEKLYFNKEIFCSDTSEKFGVGSYTLDWINNKKIGVKLVFNYYPCTDIFSHLETRIPNKDDFPFYVN